MAEQADELYLPNAVLLRIIKDSLPERTIVNREARSAISKAVSSFILYVTSLASTHCSNAKRKTLMADDIFAALKEMQFDYYLPTLTTFLQSCRLKSARKKLENRTTASGTNSLPMKDPIQRDSELTTQTHLESKSPPPASSSISLPKLNDVHGKVEPDNNLEPTEEEDDDEEEEEEEDQFEEEEEEEDNEEILVTKLEENPTVLKEELAESLDS